MRLLAPFVLLIGAAPAAAELPETVRTMIDTAYRSGDDKTIDAVVGVAKASFPELRTDIDALVKIDTDALADIRRVQQEQAQARILEARFLDLWKGEVEVGGQRSTGSTDTLGLYAAGAIERNGIAWRQKLSGRIDYQRTRHITSAERWIAAWQPQYKVDERLYGFGLAQYEHDRFLGYRTRLTGGGGLGYRAVMLRDVRIDLEGGPAVRYTDLLAQPSETTLAGRASVAIRWTIGDNLTFVQNGAVYVEQRDKTATASTALDTRLIGALKARLSYNLQYERNPSSNVDRLDTISRATLVYGF